MIDAKTLEHCGVREMRLGFSFAIVTNNNILISSLDRQLTQSLSPSNHLSVSEMDLDSIAEKVSNLTVYDLKAGFRKAQNGKTQVQDDY